MKEFLRSMTLSAWAVVAGLALILIVVGWCTYDANRDRRAHEARVQANATVTNRDTGARETAADERVTDTLNTANTRQELSDAIAQLPDDVPSARRVALGCQRLRRQGVRDADLPAACGPAGSAQTRAPP